MLLLILPIVALLTSILSGVIGMGGGMLLLATMFAFMSHAEAIPAHGAVQLISNSTRTFAFLRHVDWPTVGRFLIGVVPGAALGVWLLVMLGSPQRSEPWLKLLVGVYILGSLALGRGRGAPKMDSRSGFVLLGLAAGAAAFTVGAVGPLIAPLFARRAFVKERLIATKAVCQSLLHLAKIPVFLTIRTFPDLTGLGLVTILMAVLVIPGTLLGKRLLKRVSEERFVMLYRVALTVAGLKVILIDGLRPLLFGA